MKLCDTCIYRNNVELLKPCIVYRDNCEYYKKERGDMTKVYELPNEKRIMADVDEKHHTATVSVYALDNLVEAVNKTGTWEEDIDNSRKWDKVRFYCSECGHWQTYGKTDYCPNCGARMTESEE